MLSGNFLPARDQLGLLLLYQPPYYTAAPVLLNLISGLAVEFSRFTVLGDFSLPSLGLESEVAHEFRDNHDWVIWTIWAYPRLSRDQHDGTVAIHRILYTYWSIKYVICIYINTHRKKESIQEYKILSRSHFLQ